MVFLKLKVDIYLCFLRIVEIKVVDLKFLVNLEEYIDNLRLVLR